MDYRSCRSVFARSLLLLTGFLSLTLGSSVVGYAAIEVCPERLPPALPIMGTNSASNELLWVRPEVPDVCVTSAEIEARAKLGSLGFHTCETGGTPGFGVVTTDVNRGQVLWYPSGVGPPEIVCDASSPDCAERANHVALNSDGLLAIADTGESGADARIGFFEPTGACTGPFGDAVFTDPLRITGGGPPITIEEIIDLEYSDQIGGNFCVDCLLVLSGSPSRLLLIEADDIAEFLSNGSQPAVNILLSDADFTANFGDAVPTSITIVPGSGGLGQSGSGSKSPVVLMGLNDPNQVVELRFDSADNYTAPVPVLVDSNTGISPARMDAGLLENINLLYIATGNGVFHQFTLEVDGNASSDGDVVNLSQTAAPIAIAAGVQNPGGVEVLDDVVVAELCVDDGAVSTDTGCSVGFGQFHFSQFVATPPSPTSTLSVEYRILEDGDGLRDSDGQYALPDGGLVPSWCRGFPLPDDPDGRAVLVELQVTAGGFSVDPGETVQLKELLQDLFPEFGTCPESFARIAYLEDPPDRVNYPGPYDSSADLRSISFSCTNPGRGAGPASSTFVYCRDALKALTEDRRGRIRGRDRRTVESEVESRLLRLETFVNELPAGLPDASTRPPTQVSLKANLLGLIAAARDSLQGGNPDYLEAAGYLDLAAVIVFDNKTVLSDTTTLPSLGYSGPDNIYGIVLTDSLAMSFFFAQTLTYSNDLLAATGDDVYCPPQDLVTPVGSAELRDISCSTSLPLPDYP